MNDPIAPWIVALTHSGFGPGRPWDRKSWAPQIHRLLESPDGGTKEFARLDPNLTARVEAIAPELAAFEKDGIRTLTWRDAEFPHRWRDRLGSKAPAVAFLAGPPPEGFPGVVAIVGSRAADAPALAFAASVAQGAVRQGWAVASGGARGIDLVAIQEAARAGGMAIVVAADAMEEVRRRLDRSGLDADRITILSVSHPRAGFSVGLAMARNKLVYSLADVAVVAACEANTGGTWVGAIEAIQSHYAPVCVWTGPESTLGNQELVRAGALGISAPVQVFEREWDCAQPTLLD